MRLVFLWGLILSSAQAQTSAGRVHDHNLNGWFVYSGDHRIAGRWGLHLEGQLRRHDVLLRPQQVLVRPAVNYQLKPSIMLSAGYAYVTTHRYGEYPVQAPFPEHRIYQQAIIQHRTKGLDFQHRLRTEQRWLGQSLISPSGELEDRTWRYQNRFRYMIRLAVPLKTSGWYFATYDELFLNYAPRHGARIFDQNRVFAGIGRVIARETRLEFGYMQQTLLQRNARVLELNHTIQVGVFSRLPFGRASGDRK